MGKRGIPSAGGKLLGDDVTLMDGSKCMMLEIKPVVKKKKHTHTHMHVSARGPLIS